MSQVRFDLVDADHIHHLALVKDLKDVLGYGQRLFFQPLDVVVDVKSTDLMVVATVKTFTSRNSRGGRLVTHAGVKYMTWMKQGDALVRQEDMVLLEELDTPVLLSDAKNPVDFSYENTRYNWVAMCGHPGDGSRFGGRDRSSVLGENNKKPIYY